MMDLLTLDNIRDLGDAYLQGVLDAQAGRRYHNNAHIPPLRTAYDLGYQKGCFDQFERHDPSLTIKAAS